jgi:hypothetical protein
MLNGDMGKGTSKSVDASDPMISPESPANK